MTPLQQRIFDYLKNKNCDVERDTILAVAKKAGYKADDVYTAMRELCNIQSTIGAWSDGKTRVQYMRWYEPSELTNKVQECLNRGDDW